MILRDYQKGDLVAWSASNGVMYPGIYMGNGISHHHFWPLTTTLQRLALKKKPLVDYITGIYAHKRIIRINPDVLEPEQLRIYKEIKGI